MLKIFAQFQRLIAPCIRAPGGKFSLVLFFIAIALSLGSVYLALRLTAWTGDFYSAIQKVDGPEAVRQIGIFAAIVAINSVRGLAYEYLRKVIEIRWRRSLTEHAIAVWTSRKAYWHLANGAGERIDNPDQRIAEDCRLFTKGILGEALDLIGEIVGLFSYVVLLWGLASFPLSLAFIGLDFEIPRYMVWAAFLYVAVSSVVTHLLGRPLKGLVSEQQKREAGFRFAMARWRGSFDEVALADGEAAERAIFRQRFEDIAGNWRHLIRREFLLGCFTFPFRHTVLRIPLFVALPGYLAGHVAFGGLMQLSMAFSNVVTTLSWFIFSYRDLADLVATSGRLDNFLRAAEAAGGPRPAPDDGAAAEMRDLSLFTPSGERLLAIDHLKVAPGEAVWLQGRSGLGKTTLVKAIAGLWPHRQGEISWPQGRAMFLPQKPYFPSGTLAAAAAYPADLAGLDPSAVTAALEKVGLSHRAPDMPVAQDDRPDGLSGGELQRLALARVLVNRPGFLVLDEATSALDAVAEKSLFAMLRRELPSTAFLVISHRKPQGLGSVRHITLSDPSDDRAEDGPIATFA
jgi:vitamin B12/bleomycin/antimicrobial peptide transport system ATP-binding/permease protein